MLNGRVRGLLAAVVVAGSLVATDAMALTTGTSAVSFDGGLVTGTVSCSSNCSLVNFIPLAGLGFQLTGSGGSIVSSGISGYQDVSFTLALTATGGVTFKNFFISAPVSVNSSDSSSEASIGVTVNPPGTTISAGTVGTGSGGTVVSTQSASLSFAATNSVNLTFDINAADGSVGTTTSTFNVPEPSAVVLMLTALLGLVGLRRQFS